MSTNHERIRKFIEESNMIEGETNLDIDPRLLRGFLKRPLTIESLHTYHKQLVGDETWAGKWRDIQVWVGHYEPPHPIALDNLMKEYFEEVEDITPFQAHNRFEQIHPYQDFNGRMGRAIWLKKTYDNYGSIPNRGFLHSYYYETLESME